MPIDIVIYHNPECGTSRNALAMIRNAGLEPHVIEYLKTPPSRRMLENLIERAALAQPGVDQTDALEQISPINIGDQPHAGDDIAHTDIGGALPLLGVLNNGFDRGALQA